MVVWYFAVECELPQDPKHGNAIVYEGKATYTCESCYTLRGESTRVCLSNGQWEGKEPTCSSKSRAKGKYKTPVHIDIMIFRIASPTNDFRITKVFYVPAILNIAYSTIAVRT